MSKIDKTPVLKVEGRVIAGTQHLNRQLISDLCSAVQETQGNEIQ
jgi:hypothetical protein